MKKRFCLVLSLLMLAACIPASAGGGEWKYDEEYCILRGYGGAGGNVVVPGEINGGTVDVIDVNVFQSETITGLELPETVLELRSNAISRCGNLTDVSLPQSLVVINRMNFGSCKALKEITIPAGVRYIGDSSFRFCESLRTITFEGVCPVIDANCFTGLSEDAAAYVPDDQLAAYTAAFEKAGSEVTVRPSGKNAVAADNNGYAESEFDFDKETGTIIFYNGYATYLSIPETIGGAAVKAIGPEAFAYHCYLALLELPEGLEHIGEGAFEGCETLGHVKFPSTLKTIGDRAFYNAYAGSTLELPSAEHIGAHAFYFAGLSGDMEFPEGLKTIGEGAFESCGSLGDLYLPSTLESIGSNAFKGDYNIQYVVLNSLTPPALGEDVFKGCDYLADIDLNAHGTKAQMRAWQAYTDALGLSCRVWRAQDSTASSPEKGTYRYENRMLTAYTGTAARLRAHLTVDTEPVIGLGEGVFKDSRTIKYFSVAHNDAFAVIGAEAFMNSSLKAVDLFDSVTEIGARAFAGCSQLEELTLPDSVTEIGEGALDGLTGLKKLVIQCNPTIIPAGAFANLPELTDVTVETGAIPAHMFEGSGVKALTLGEGVSEIGESAFEGTALENVCLSASVSVGERAFADTKLTKVVIPADGSFALSAAEGTNAELRLPADATDEQVDVWNERLNRPWYDSILREGEESRFVKMPFEPTPAENFEFDAETGLISAYIGTDADVVVPRAIDGVTVAGFQNYNAFESCRDYTDTEIESNVTEWVHLRSVVLPETIRELPDSLFEYCQQLETFVCYAPLESTGRSTFMGCRSLNNVIFVNGVRNIDNYAFDSAGTLGNLYFGEHLLRIGQQAFGFSGLTSFIADAETIESNAFVGCESLTCLHLTPKVKRCGEYMVSNCPSLTEICFDGCDLTASEMGLVCNVAPKLTVRVFEGMSGENLSHAENCVAWNSSEAAVSVTTEPCAHTLPERPDVSALLSGLQSGASTETAAPEAAAESETASESVSAPASAVSAEIMIGKKYVMTDADVSGYNMTAEQFGNYEYSVLLHEDGTAAFVIAGADIPGLTWVFGKVPAQTGETDGIVIDYYTQALNLVPTEKGFDVDYFGSMLMHFALERSVR